ncbi:MAG: class I SAM-dependent methyltransferase [Solirubrobacteraceae bacterium]
MKPLATELRDADRALERLPAIQANVPRLIARLRTYATIPPGADVLDVGAAQGVQVAALLAAGFSAVGVEPSAPARHASELVGERVGRSVEIVAGSAERLPFADESFHLVLANSVMEHANDPAAAASEAYRVLRLGGGFFFSTTSALSPRQREIRGFPAFPWYPDAVKRGIMRWALTNRPQLIGHTTTPAYHWFTPRRARGLAAMAHFSAFYDRWDVRTEEGLGPLGVRAFRLARRRPVLRRLGDVFFEGSSYLFVK